MNGHDFRSLGRGQELCVRCARVHRGPLADGMICEGLVHAGPEPLCGAPPDAPSASAHSWNNAVTCAECIAAAAALPPPAGHDLRLWGPGLACPRCGQWGADHLGFGGCPQPGRKHAGYCAPPSFPDAPAPAGAFGDFPVSLCGKGPAPSVRVHMGRPHGEGGETHGSPARGWTDCGGCRDRFGDLPPLPPAAHDARLAPGGAGAACAACGLIAPAADGLGETCDGGLALAAIAARRSGATRAWLPGGYASRPLHAGNGCAAARGHYWKQLRIAEDGVHHGTLPPALRARVTCIPCVRAFARAPAIPA